MIKIKSFVITMSRLKDVMRNGICENVVKFLIRNVRDEDYLLDEYEVCEKNPELKGYDYFKARVRHN